jgi:Arc/MetJ-type ribon-helix-helix transcriptional regulator
MKRITISVPDEVAAKARRVVDAGRVPSMSAYFAQLAQRDPDREPDWAAARAVVDELVAALGGLSDDDIAWAEHSLGIR